jgi:hypothetical protein
LGAERIEGDLGAVGHQLADVLEQAEDGGLVNGVDVLAAAVALVADFGADQAQIFELGEVVMHALARELAVLVLALAIDRGHEVDLVHGLGFLQLGEQQKPVAGREPLEKGPSSSERSGVSKRWVDDGWRFMTRSPKSPTVIGRTDRREGASPKDQREMSGSRGLRLHCRACFA